MSLTLKQTWHSNEYGTVEVIGSGPLSDRFRLIEQEGRASYLVFADTMKYRMDGQAHPLDVSWNQVYEEIGGAA